MSDEIRPFRIDVPQAVLDDLRDRLVRTRWPDQIGAPWEYGTDVAELKRLCDHWRDGFDWRAAEATLNAFPQYTTEIDGQHVHFLHVRSPHAGALPLLVTHGWPGSVWEFTKIIGPLVDPVAHGGRAEDAFHVIAPSMPGYGFSGPTVDGGWHPKRIAETWATLMARLGYERYGAQGGDWGAIVTSALGTVDPAHLAGIHVNMITAGPPAGVADPMAGLTEVERADVASTAWFREHETGYQQIQGTKPQTLAYGLHDSPTGLAGWILEKFRTWSDCGGDVLGYFGLDDLLANITIYWVTGTIGSSCRLYCESRRAGAAGRASGRVEVPTGAAVFPKEIYRVPRAWAEAAYHVTHWARYDRGGHFAAMEVPDLLVSDVRTFFATVR